MQTTYINMHMHKHTNFTPDFNVTICNQQCSLAKLLAHSNPKSISPENVFFSYCRCHDSNSCCQKTCFKHLFFFFIMKMECNQLGWERWGGVKRAEHSFLTTQSFHTNITNLQSGPHSGDDQQLNSFTVDNGPGHFIWRSQDDLSSFNIARHRNSNQDIFCL